MIRSLLASVVLSGSVLASNVLVVGSGAPYGTIQDAVNAAVDGDVILVRSGASSAGFTIGNKSLLVTGDPGPFVVTGDVLVQGLGAGRSVGLMRLHITSPGTASTALRVVDCAGFVRVEDCRATGGAAVPGGTTAGPGLTIENSPVVLASWGQFTGGHGSEGDIFVGPLPAQGGPGIRAEISSCALWESSCFGGYGDDAYLYYDGGDGGHGIDSVTGNLFLSRVDVHGGRGGNPNCCGYPGDGGDGLRGDGGTLLRSLALFAAYGLGGTGSGGCGACEGGGSWPPGVNGIAVRNAGTTETLSGNPKHMNRPLIVREGGVMTLEFTGEPGEIVGLIASDTPTHQYVAARGGVQHSSTAPTAAHRIVRLGTIGVGGSLVRSFPQPDLGPGVAAQVRYLQPLFSAPGGTIRLGSPATVLLLDSAY